VVDKNDIEVAEKIARLHEWRGTVDKRLDTHESKIKGVEEWQTAVINAKKMLIPAMTFGFAVAFVVYYVVLYQRDPASAKAILESLIK